MSKKKSSRGAPRKRSGRESRGMDPRPYRFDRFHMADAVPYDEDFEYGFEMEAGYEGLDEVEDWRSRSNPYGDSDLRGRRPF